MRDILFRGKRVDNGEWVYGTLVHRTKYYGDTTDKWFVLHGGEFDCDYYDAEEVLPDTIGQYTGMTDIKGNRIFEGDMLRKYNVIEFCNGSFCENGDTPLSLLANNFSIIGNVFDNPSLLKDKGEG